MLERRAQSGSPESVFCSDRKVSASATLHLSLLDFFSVECWPVV